MIKSIPCFFLFIITFILNAQSQCVKVLFSQGDIEVVQGDKALKPKTGVLLCGVYKIKLKKGAAIALINDKNQSSLIDVEGIYSKDQIETKFKDRSLKSVGKAYMDLIIEKLVNSNQEEDQYYKLHKKFFVDPAGVERGVKEKYLALPSKSKVLPGTATIYTLVELNKTPVSAQVFDYQSSSYSTSFKIETDKLIKLNLKGQTGKEAHFSIIVKTNQGMGEVNYMLDVVKHPFLVIPKPEDEFTALDWFGLGLALEQNNYYIDALHCLIEAQHQKPEIDFYSENIIRLLNLIGFENEESAFLAKYWKYNIE